MVGHPGRFPARDRREVDGRNGEPPTKEEVADEYERFLIEGAAVDLEDDGQ